MGNNIRRNTVCALLAGFLTASASAAPAIQTIPGNGVVAGLPGSAAGFGFALNYSGPDWVVLNDSIFTGSQVYETYKDYIVNQFVVAGPAPESSSVTIPFIKSAAGLGEFDIFATSPDVTVTGNVVVDYSLFSQDPNSPNFDPGSFVSSGQASAPVTIQIVPEPRFLGLLAVAAGFAFALCRRSKFRWAHNGCRGNEN